MPKYFVHSIIVTEVEAPTPKDAVRMTYDGDVPRNCETEAWVDTVYAEDNITKVWPEKTSRFPLGMF